MPSSIAVQSSLPSSHAARRALRGLGNTTPSLFSPSKLKVRTWKKRDKHIRGLHDGGLVADLERLERSICRLSLQMEHMQRHQEPGVVVSQ